jgi:hypothetical protein
MSGDPSNIPTPIPLLTLSTTGSTFGDQLRTVNKLIQLINAQLIPEILNGLETDAKDTLVNAINEVYQIALAGGGGPVLGLVPFFKADGSPDNIPLTLANKVPFFKADGTASNISLV